LILLSILLLLMISLTSYDQDELFLVDVEELLILAALIEP